MGRERNAIAEMKGTPQRPDPTKPGLHIPVSIRMEPEVPFEMPETRPARGEEAPGRAYIMKRHYEEHGYTVDAKDAEDCWQG